MQRVRDLMTSNPRTCPVDGNILSVLEIMKNENCGIVPIVGQDQKLQGVLTDRDIALCILEKANQTPDQIRIQDCLKQEQLLTCRPDDDLHRAVSVMEQNQVRRLPVVDENQRVIGLLSQADIVLKNEDRAESAEFVREVSKPRQTIGSNP